jgi:hypothetical protein
MGIYHLGNISLAAIGTGVRLAACPRSGLDGPAIDYQIPVAISVADYERRAVALDFARRAHLIFTMGEQEERDKQSDERERHTDESGFHFLMHFFYSFLNWTFFIL